MTKTGFLTTALVLILLLAGGLRLGIVMRQSDQLREDRDAYIAIARNLAAGNGFTSSRMDAGQDLEPTAFRPPLYPCLLAVGYYLNAGPQMTGILQVLLGIATVWFTWKTGQRLQLKWAALFAAGIVATDPILLQYTSYSMTEVLATFLCSLLLYLLICSFSTRAEELSASTNKPLLFWTGAVWGLAILCRPTFLAFLGIWLVIRLADSLKQRLLSNREELRPASVSQQIAFLAAGIILAVSPWLIRNLVVFRAPILTTTHGGYTLLLGNNPVFYNEVVQQPWGTVWTGESLDAWQKSLEVDIAQLQPALETEQERDRWMYQRARQNISSQPLLFAQSCLLRLKRFWNIAPLASAGQTPSRTLLLGVASYYFVVLLGCLWGACLVIWKRERNWSPLIWLLVSFTIVHLFYWTNMRMRAPLVPAIALLSVFGWSHLIHFCKIDRLWNRPNTGHPKS
ncbi:glycosyltransferase family 39 protein [Gimesia chilikensis]|uniref:glycosyltransferase family 39 protein n=1 Tax=Gimesia chilikensis TaxID=2605989 RepID=UPI0011EBF4D8|nr:glycosyltransferase family 39 protein [Gimesia chilikensis]KAA0140647.1 glycosyltransferase family 39 protein [Gimesia chilikensis]